MKWILGMSHLISPHLTEAPDSDCCWLLELLGCNMWLCQQRMRRGVPAKFPPSLTWSWMEKRAPM